MLIEKSNFLTLRMEVMTDGCNDQCICSYHLPSRNILINIQEDLKEICLPFVTISNIVKIFIHYFLTFPSVLLYTSFGAPSDYRRWRTSSTIIRELQLIADTKRVVLLGKNSCWQFASDSFYHYNSYFLMEINKYVSS